MGAKLRSLSLPALILVPLLLTPPLVLCTSRNDLLTATEEMQRANYFTFVLLINMSPSDKIPPNVTFLMPSDRMLSKTAIPENAVSDFLLRHSIPSALLFDHLQHFPSDSLIPSSWPDYMIKILNHGRKSFFMNNVRLVSPNLCVNGSSVRCHGIDGILEETNPLSCSSGSPSPPKQAPLPPKQAPLPPKQMSPPSPSPPLEAPPPSQPSLMLPPPFPAPPPPVNWTMAIAPGPSDSPTGDSGRSGAVRLDFGGKMEYLTALAVILILYVYVC
ncbi:hypothetical protein V2J09_002075 [Rumex salicifolius]